MKINRLSAVVVTMAAALSVVAIDATAASAQSHSSPVASAYVESNDSNADIRYTTVAAVVANTSAWNAPSNGEIGTVSPKHGAEKLSGVFRHCGKKGGQGPLTKLDFDMSFNAKAHFPDLEIGGYGMIGAWNYLDWGTYDSASEYWWKFIYFGVRTDGQHIIRVMRDCDTYLDILPGQTKETTFPGTRTGMDITFKNYRVATDGDRRDLTAFVDAKLVVNNEEG